MFKVCLAQGQRLGNRICQQLAGYAISQILGFDEPHGHKTPELFSLQKKCTCTDAALILNGQEFDLDLIKNLFRIKLYNRVLLRGWGMRLEYYKISRDYWLRRSLVNDEMQIHKISDGEVAIHIRLGDSLAGKHFRYFPLPLDYYSSVVDDLGKEPVFIGEFGSNSEYENNLRLRFSGARFVQSDPVSDWASLFFAHTKVLSISSFSWTASWLGIDNSKVILPIAGMFHPLINPTVDLIPWNDPRFEMRWFAPINRTNELSLSQHLDSLTELSNGFPKMNSI